VSRAARPRRSIQCHSGAPPPRRGGAHTHTHTDTHTVARFESLVAQMAAKIALASKKETTNHTQPPPPPSIPKHRPVSANHLAAIESQLQRRISEQEGPRTVSNCACTQKFIDVFFLRMRLYRCALTYSICVCVCVRLLLSTLAFTDLSSLLLIFFYLFLVAFARVPTFT